MVPIFKDDYEKREWLSRESLKQLKDIYPEFFKYDIQFTPGQYDDFDAFYFIYDENGKFKKYVWIELKMRDKTFSEYILEKEKLDRINKHRERLYIDKDQVVILYINFCPEGTYCWNISNVDDGKWEKLLANKSTSNNRTDKEMKKVKYLKPSDSKQFDYILIEKQLLRNYKSNYLMPKVEEKIKRVNNLNFLFED